MPLTLKGDACWLEASALEKTYGKNIESQDCISYGPTQYCYKCSFTWFSKTIAYSTLVRTSEGCFGCSNVVDGKFCINSYNSTKLTRCLEVSDSNACTDCYFCHNCENLENCMFCFNTKAKRYAIANKELGREKYLELKKRIQEDIVKNLEEKRDLKYNIYGLG